MRRLICAGAFGLAASVSASAQTAPQQTSSVPTRKASVVTAAPALLPYFNNGPVFGLAGTDAEDFGSRTQVSGDWGGLRTDLARHGLFFDLYSTSAYQNVASGGSQPATPPYKTTSCRITPAIRLIPSYQHIWNPTTAKVAKNERGADVFLLRSSVAW